MKRIKRKLNVVAALAALLFGVFVNQTFLESKSPYDEANILTAVHEDMDGIVIAETRVPLGPAADVSGQETEHPYIQQVVDLVNAERTKAGVALLTATPELNNAAGIRAEEISTLFSHDRPNGTRYRTVLDDNAISYRGCGENVASGYRTPEEVVSGWMGSDGHKENLLKADYTSIGIGYYKDSNGYSYWAQIFTY
ncbi:MAG: hypothetical protein IJ374_00460 [Lachnospiraceae bacterium]|nr:hypothetical protein [Lachnospiraceae bacterium]